MRTGKMKFWTFALFALIGLTSTWGQGIADKKTQAGLTGTFGMNVLRMGTNKMNSNGIGSDLGIGIMIHSSFKNSKNLGLAYGLEFEFGSFKFSPANLTYYDYNDKEILSDKNSGDLTGSFQLQERTQKPVYVTIPLMFLFKTDFIGDFRYFGKFGVRNNFLVSNKMNDSGIDMSTGQSVDFLNMKSSGETFFYNGSVGLTAGAEWNFVGSTVLVAEAGYFYGITP
ncbi:MAG: hypothetical protein FJZ67_08755, partial [Bacteroidetes bacterium]|nr:hypothetical protein [Bacteroidota bacterium]